MAQKSPIERQSIKNASHEIKKLMVSSLSYILLQEEKAIYQRILYLCRLSKGCGFDVTAEEIYKLGLEFDMNDLSTVVQELCNYKNTYLIEMLIMANISEEASESIIMMITDFASMFEITKEELRVLGLVAKGVLVDNEDFVLNMPVPSKNMWSGKLQDYFGKKWIVKQRIDCGLLCTKKYSKKDISSSNERYASLFASINSVSGQKSNDYKEEYPCEIVKRVQAGTVVKKGDQICSYKAKIPKKKEQNNDLYARSSISAMMRAMTDESTQEYDEIDTVITAPCNGVVFFVDDKKSGEVKDKNDEYIAVYVVSYFDDYTDFSAWYKGRFSSKKK